MAVSVGGNETILFVEDEESVRNLTLRMLQQRGYNVLVAAQSNEAIEIAKKHSGLMDFLTDVVLPNMSGKQLAGAVLADRVVAILASLLTALSMYATTAMLEQLLSRGGGSRAPE